MHKIDRIYRRYFHYSPASWAIILATLTLAVLGLLVMQRLSEGMWGDEARGWLEKQAIFLAVSVLAAILLGSTNYLRVGRWAYPLFALTLAMLLAVLVFGYLGRYVSVVGKIFPAINFSHRWIRLGFFQLQPSEFLKITYILGLARYLRYRKNYRQLSGFIGPFAFTLLPIVLILLEPDLGTAMLLLPVMLIMLFAAGAKIRHLAAVVLMILVAGPMLFFWVMKDYQRERITGVLLQSARVRTYLQEHPGLKQKIYPEPMRRWLLTEGYQLERAKLAMGSGGVLGYDRATGPDAASPRLPECHNDFIFSMIGHIFGLIGTVSVVLLYVILSVGLIEIASIISEPFGRLIAVGTFAMIVTQALLNMAMTLGLTPITGVTLPFVSYGGSSLLTYFILAGLALSVDRTRPIMIAPKPFEFHNKGGEWQP